MSTSRRFIANAVDVLERSRLGPICACTDDLTARWLADVLNEAHARGDLKPLPPVALRYAAEGLHVIDTEAGNARVCECATEDFARRTAGSLNLQLHLLEDSEPLTADWFERLRPLLDPLSAPDDPLAAARQRGVWMQKDLLWKAAEALGVPPQALEDTLAALHTTSPWGGLNFLISEDATLGASPIAALRAGRIAEVIAAASRYAEHGAP